MAQEQNYQVNYTINVDASQGTKQVIGEAVGKLVQAKDTAIKHTNKWIKWAKFGTEVIDPASLLKFAWL